MTDLNANNKRKAEDWAELDSNYSKSRKIEKKVSKRTSRPPKVEPILAAPSSVQAPDAAALMALAGQAEKRKKARKEKPPATPLDRIIYCIRELKSPRGASMQALYKKMKEDFLSSTNASRKAVDKGVVRGMISKKGMRVKVIGDPEYEDNGPKIAIEDLVIGNGDPVVKGNTVTIAYKGWLQSTGYTFDTGTSFTFTQDDKEVIKGMDQGILGMKKSGKRLITIPPELGYGKRGSGRDIPGDSWLVFEIYLKNISLVPTYVPLA